jgi:hypothetical protein
MNTHTASAIAFAILAASLTSCATINSSLSSSTVLGKVTEVYVERSAGLLVDTRLTADSPDLRHWARVELRAVPENSKLDSSMVVLSGVAVEPGDMVRIRLAPDISGNPMTTFANHRIIALATQEELDNSVTHHANAERLLRSSVATQ